MGCEWGALRWRGSHHATSLAVGEQGRDLDPPVGAVLPPERGESAGYYRWSSSDGCRQSDTPGNCGITGPDYRPNHVGGPLGQRTIILTLGETPLTRSSTASPDHRDAPRARYPNGQYALSITFQSIRQSYAAYAQQSVHPATFRSWQASAPTQIQRRRCQKHAEQPVHRALPTRECTH